MENKQKICDLLRITLQATREFKDLESLTYNKENEHVTAVFENHTKKIIINVNMDSGVAMISDIIKRIR